MRLVPLLLLALAACGGGGASAPDASSPDAAPVDAFVADAPWPDAAPPPDARPDARPPDASPPDAFVADAVWPDADPCLTCVPSGPCMVASCSLGVCSEAPAEDGTECGPEGSEGSEICVEAACVTRACGDGYREPGPGPTPAREGCDDGNAADGDACSALCAPTRFTIALRTTNEDVASGGTRPVAAADDTGKVLVVWQRYTTSSRHDLVARRYTAAGVPLDDALVIAASLTVDSEPAVAGYAGGWAVIWKSATADGSSFGIGLRLVGSDGTLAATTHANALTSGGQQDANIARVGGGFVVVWSDLGGMVERIRARRFGPTGAPLDADDLQVSVTTAAGASAAVAGTATGFLVTYVYTGGASPAVVGRRYTAAGVALDAAPIAVSTTDWSYRPAATGLDDGSYAVAWGAFSTTMNRNVWARRVPAAGDGAAEATVEIGAATTVSERSPSVAALPGGGYAVVIELYSNDSTTIPYNLGLVAVDGMLAPEASAVMAYFTEANVQSRGAIARVGDGLWVTWTADGVTSNDPIVGYVLPRP